jgi:hypothetical protein
MSELRRMAQDLLDRPLVDPPSTADLRRRSRARRSRNALGGGTALVVTALVVTILVTTLSGPSAPPTALLGPNKLASFIQAGVSVPDSVLEAVGLPSLVNVPEALSGRPALTDAGKPAVVYIGAEYCPYCAVDRWALVVALSRFGSFSNLGQVISSATDVVFPGLQSWTFHGSSYSSPYLTFDPAEIYSATQGPSGGFTPLDTLSPLQRQTMDTYDVSPLGGLQPGEHGYPFIDVGNRFVINTTASPTPLEGLTANQIAADLSDPSSLVAQTIDGSANYLIAALCQITGVNAAPICSLTFVAQAQARMAS